MALTDTINQRIRPLMLHIEVLEFEQVVRDVRRIYLSEIVGDARDPVAELAATQEIAKAVQLFLSEDPTVHAPLARRIHRYLTLLDRHGLRDELVKKRSRDVKLTKESARLVAGGALLLPVAAVGLFLNYLPIRASYWAGRLLSPRKDVVATTRFFAGSMAVLLTYPIEIWVVYRLWGLIPSLVFGGLLPLSGYFAVVYPRLFAVYLDRLRSAWIRKTRKRFVAKLRRHRARLVTELDQLRAQYLTARDGADPAAAEGSAAS